MSTSTGTPSIPLYTIQPSWHRCVRAAVLAAGCAVFGVSLAPAAERYLEPGSLRFSHEARIDTILHRLQPGWSVEKAGVNKVYDKEGNRTRPWRSGWGQSLLTEVAARPSPDIAGRFLFELQGEYADRYWRPVNVNHRADLEGDSVIVREFEARIDRPDWYLHGFSGVGHADWGEQGDLFGLFPQSFPERDYLGASGAFGFYPDRWKQDQYRNFADRRVPEGVIGEADVFGGQVAAAYGKELSWGFQESYYGRVNVPVGTSLMTFVHKSEDVPYVIGAGNEWNRAYALGWGIPFEEGHRVDMGVLYNPFRVGRSYEVARRVPSGTGVQGSDWEIGTKTSKRSDAMGGRFRYEHYLTLLERLWVGSVDLERRNILAGNVEQATLEVAADVHHTVRGSVRWRYRRPVEGPVPFLYQGTPNNIAAIVSSPRGPESPFWVNWFNREAVFLTSTFWFDPTPGTPLFSGDPAVLQGWNLSGREDAPIAFAVQHRMSDYRTTTDRHYYVDVDGKFIWETAGLAGAWPTKHPLHEARFLADGRLRPFRWSLGVAGGQAPAVLGVAYNDLPTDPTKAITEYYSIEARLMWNPLTVWGHYGTGMWGPEENIHPMFGLAFDRLWGVGATVKIAGNTTWDVAYLAARQDENAFTAPDLGSYDEIRSTLSHRFGFIFQFREPRRGYRAP